MITASASARMRLSSGPMADTKLCRHFPRIAPRSMYTAPPGRPMPPVSRKIMGNTMLSPVSAYLAGLSVR
jgi:hypothetical protein